MFGLGTDYPKEISSTPSNILYFLLDSAALRNFIKTHEKEYHRTEINSSWNGFKRNVGISRYRRFTDKHFFEKNKIQKIKSKKRKNPEKVWEHKDWTLFARGEDRLERFVFEFILLRNCVYMKYYGTLLVNRLWVGSTFELKFERSFRARRLEITRA